MILKEATLSHCYFMLSGSSFPSEKSKVIAPNFTPLLSSGYIVIPQMLSVYHLSVRAANSMWR